MPDSMKARSLEQLPTLRLGEATVQDIQLELIRRRKFNAFDGERIAAQLWEHRELWEAALMDRLALSNWGQPPANGLIKLRDLSSDDWNVDTLFILSHDAACAKKLAEIFKMDESGGMVSVYDDSEAVDLALGSGREERAIVSIWWD